MKTASGRRLSAALMAAIQSDVSLTAAMVGAVPSGAPRDGTVALNGLSPSQTLTFDGH